MDEAVNLVWLKRDLRLRDHAPLAAALATGRPCLLVYCFEPSLMAAPVSDLRHWRFVWESLQDLRRRLPPGSLLIAHAEVRELLEQLAVGCPLSAV
jgi:deoxyribodipyrimidine photo-lyase